MSCSRARGVDLDGDRVAAYRLVDGRYGPPEVDDVLRPLPWPAGD